MTQKTAARAAARAPKTGQLQRTSEAVLDAVLALLREQAYRDMTIDQIAQRSGIARSTIYRRWGSVAELVIQAFERALGPGLPSPDHGDVRTDLVHLYRRFAKILKGSLWGQVLPSLIEAAAGDAEFAQLLARLERERRLNSRTILERGIERGELTPDTPVDRIVELLSGLMYHRYLISGEKLGERGLVEWMVDAALAQHWQEG
ncbi:MAG: TetR/AcrR family transcriptional regulator [Pseudomonadota bacterium]